MKAKQFFFVCAGVFLLVSAYTMGARHARADFNPSEPTIIGYSSATALRSDGEIWRIEESQGRFAWVRADCGVEPPFQLIPPVPMPTSEIAYFEWPRVILHNGEVWTFHCPDWVREVGPISGGPIDVEGKTWSGVKEGYRNK